ncbi:hypothetical protein, partial [Microbulbifer variabilis]|uniref:hypothetical protein n=1 Tax=Microbulbifer variabilis TaxID=266805 RepID=UPI001CFE8292
PAQQRTVTNKAFGGRRRWVSIYPLAKRIFNIRIGEEQPYKALQRDGLLCAPFAQVASLPFLRKMRPK